MIHRQTKRAYSVVWAVHVCLVVSGCSLILDVGSLPGGDAAGGRAATGGRVGQPAGASPAVGGATASGSGGTGAIGAAGATAAAGRPSIAVDPNSAGTAGTAGSGDVGGTAGNGSQAHAGSTSIEACTIQPPLPSPLVGWASVTGYNVPYTTGGGDAVPLVVTNFAALAAAAIGSKAAVIHVQGSIVGSVSVGSNKTLVGICGGSIFGHVHLSNSNNVILRNLRIVGRNCSDSPTDCSNGADAVSITNGAHHIWLDHCDISDGSDGNLDITNGADLVTVSYTKFSYSSRRVEGHQFSNLVGGADDVAVDVERLNVTFHHNWWADNIDTWMPRTRRGKIHVFNNLFTSVGNDNCTNAGFEAAVRVENNVYVGVNEPLSPDANSVGLESIGNVFIGTTGNTEGLRSSFVPPYRYTLYPTDDLQTRLENEVGPK